MSVVVWTLHTDEKSFVLNPIITKFSQIIALMSTAIWPILVKIGLKTKKIIRSSLNCTTLKKSPKMANNKHCSEELEEKKCSTIQVYFGIPESWLRVRIPGPSPLLAAHFCWKYVTYIYRIFQQAPSPMTNFLKNKEKYSIHWQYKSGLELTSWNFL